jgi:hypothetical protein
VDGPPLHYQPHVLHGGGNPGFDGAQSVFADLAGVATDYFWTADGADFRG